MKVCHLVDNARPGVGVTQVVHDLMTAEGAECRGIFTGQSDLDARFARLIGQGAITLAATPAALLRALFAAWRDGFRLLHVHSRKAAWFLVLARLCGFRIVRTQHFGTLAGGRSKWPQPLTHLRNLLTGRTWWVDRWAAVSGTSKRYIQNRWEVPEERISVVWNGIDVDRFTPCSTDSRPLLRQQLGWQEDWIVLISVGSLVARKRHDSTIRAFARIPDRPAQARLVLLGEGEERSRLDQLISTSGLQGKVLLPGRQADVATWVAAADIFVHAALDEAFGLAVVEAMACGKPAIVAGTMGPAEIVEDGETGLLVADGSVAGLSQAMARLMADDGLRNRLGQMARRQAVERYSLSAMCRNYASLYSAVLSAPGQAHG